MDPLAALIDQHQRALWRYLRLLGADPHEADDLMQDALVRFARGQRDGEVVHAPAAFLRGIARNLLLAARRRARLRPPAVAWLDAVDRLWQREPEAFGEARLEALRDCIPRLPERARRAIEWHHLEGLSRRATAARLGVGDEGAKSLLDRARVLLRQCIERRLRGAMEP